MLATQHSRYPTYLGRPRPRLVCIDLQREYVVPGRPLYDAAAAMVANACRRVLEHARASGWRIIHTQRRTVSDASSESRHFGSPIEGLRPLVSEPVFVRRGLSAFSNPAFAEEMRDAQGEDVFLIGFSLNHTCLATALAAVDLGLSVTVVDDAMGVAPCAGIQTGRAGEIAEAILTPFVQFTSSGDVIEAT